jgi:phosphoglycolate phosphatase
MPRVYAATRPSLPVNGSDAPYSPPTAYDHGKYCRVGDLLVLWDLDGTLLHAGRVGSDLYALVFAGLFGRSPEVLAPMAGRTDRAIILETLELAGISDPRRYVDPFIAGLSAHAPGVRDAVAAQGRALPGAAAAIAATAALPSPGRVYQSVLTGNVRPMAEVKLSALGLHELLDLRIGAYGDDHEVRAELVHLARRRATARHGLRPADLAGSATVVIGDTPLDIVAALAADARAVGVATGRYPAADLVAAGAHAVLPDLTDAALVVQALSASLPRRIAVTPGAGRARCRGTDSRSGRPAARHCGEHGLSCPVQPRSRRLSATCAATAHAARVTSCHP